MRQVAGLRRKDKSDCSPHVSISLGCRQGGGKDDRVDYRRTVRIRRPDPGLASHGRSQ